MLPRIEVAPVTNYKFKFIFSGPITSISSSSSSLFYQETRVRSLIKISQFIVCTDGQTDVIRISTRLTYTYINIHVYKLQEYEMLQPNLAFSPSLLVSLIFVILSYVSDGFHLTITFFCFQKLSAVVHNNMLPAKYHHLHKHKVRHI